MLQIWKSGLLLWIYNRPSSVQELLSELTNADNFKQDWFSYIFLHYLLEFTQQILPHFLPQPANCFTWIYLPYLWNFVILSQLCEKGLGASSKSLPILLNPNVLKMKNWISECCVLRSGPSVLRFPAEDRIHHSAEIHPLMGASQKSALAKLTRMSAFEINEFVTIFLH